LERKIISRAVFAACIFLVIGSVSGATYYVDANGSDNDNGLSWQTAFATIQKAIDTAGNGDIIDVNTGTYYETANFSGKAITLQSTNPDDANIVSATIINGNSSDKVVLFENSEDSNSVISGFTITGGGKGIYCFSVSPTIANCIVRDNNDSGIMNLKDSEPNITNCTITSNHAKYGAGIYNLLSSPKINSCTFTQNIAASRGGGVYNSLSSPTITGCTFLNNTAATSGAGIFSSLSSPVIKNCVITHNIGSGIAGTGSVINCTIAYNNGIGIYDCNNGTIKNCILWGNDDDLSNCSAIYSCIQDGNSGTGNFNYVPYFTDVDSNNFHLLDYSPCVDAGDPNDDYSNEPNGGGGRINMGAYGNTAEAAVAVDSDNDGLPDSWEFLYWPSDNPNLHDPNDNSDDDDLTNLQEYYIGVDPTNSDTDGDGLTDGYEYNNNMDPLDSDMDNDGMPDGWELNHGLDPYVDDSVGDMDNDNMPNGYEYTYGLDPNNFSDADSDLDADEYNNLCEYFHASNPNDINSTPSVNMVIYVPAPLNSIQRAINVGIDGDTIKVSQGTYYENIVFNGKNLILTSLDPNDSNVVSATIISGNNTGKVVTFNDFEDANAAITGFTIQDGNDGGIYCYQSSPEISKCIIIDNSSYGIYCDYNSSPTIEDCIIKKSELLVPLVYDCGRGIDCNFASPKISGCTMADCMTGLKCKSSSPVVKNCTISNNRFIGVNCSSSSATIANCTIVGNGWTGIIGECNEVRNCIIWDNRDDIDGCSAIYSCIQDGDTGTGNINYIPYFVDIDSNDYHLMSYSPCINTGAPNDNYSNEPDPNGGRIDMGVYGNTAEATSASSDSDNDGLPDDWEIPYWFMNYNQHDANDDSDGDGMINIDEYHYGFDPTASDANEDTDGDGIPNGWEHENGLNPINADGTLDFDGDGYNNLTEYLHGSEPDDPNNQPTSNLTIEVPADVTSIQLAVDGTMNGDIVVVSPGIYYEEVYCYGKDITITSTDPNNWDIVNSTIIDASNGSAGIVVYYAGNGNSAIKGLTIKNAYESCGIQCIDTSIKITNCHLMNNDCGLYIVASNSNYITTISNNIIADNYCAVYFNDSYGSQASIRDNFLSNNIMGISAGSGSNKVVQNNTIIGSVYGILGTTSTQISNCIIWDCNDNLYNCSATYSCLSDANDIGDANTTHNINDEPLFVNSDANDYHLSSNSPCINTGDPNGNYVGQKDIDFQKRVRGDIIDMGADEYGFVIYVNVDANSGGEGSSWSDALNDIPSALSIAASGNEIWVAEGIYKPTNGTDRTISFNLKSNVALYGGFYGDEIHRSERLVLDTGTILSGDISGSNSYHVVKGADNAILDSFVIMAGSADGTGQNAYGGGIFNDTASPVIKNCIIIGNNATNGGAMYNKSAIPEITNCIFSGNTSSSYGGAIYNESANPSIVSCSFSNNTASGNGKSIYNTDSSPGIINSIIWGNDSSIYNADSNKPYISYSNIQDCGGSDSNNWNSNFGIDGGSNIDSNPLFIDPNGTDNINGTLDDNLDLASNSPCVGTGLGGENMGASLPVDSVIIGESNSITGPVDLAIDSNGLLYVLSSGQQSHVKIYSNQLVLQDTMDVNAAYPKGMALDVNDNIYIADTGGNRILKYTSAGVLDADFGTNGITGQFGSGDGEFNEPWGIAVDFDGFVYVTDSNNNRVQVFESDGTFYTKWGVHDSNDGNLSHPSGFCLVPSGLSPNMVLADTANNRIQRLSAQTGYFYSKAGEIGSGAGQFDTPRDVCYDFEHDQIVVADSANNRIQIFQLHSYGSWADNEMTFTKEILDANLSNPMAVVCADESNDSNQIIFVADTGNNRILKLLVKQDEPGNSPMEIIESFKSALRMRDVNRATSFILEPFVDAYAEIFNGHIDDLQDLAEDMGQMTLVSDDGGMRLYEISNLNGIKFPVVFSMDDEGNWKISQL